MCYSQDSTYSATVQTSLKSLVLEDLNMKEDSKYRRLVASNSKESAAVGGRPRLNSFMSTSCPDLRNQNFFLSNSLSLPARLHPMKLPWKSARKNAAKKDAAAADGGYPGTPPSSPVMNRNANQSSASSENLVFIKVFMSITFISIQFNHFCIAH